MVKIKKFKSFINKNKFIKRIFMKEAQFFQNAVTLDTSLVFCGTQEFGVRLFGC